MSLRNIQWLVLSLSLAASANATSSFTGVAVSRATSFNPLEQVDQNGVSRVSLNGAQLLDTFLAEGSSDGNFNSEAVVAFDKVARCWSRVEEAPAPSVAPEAKPKATASMKIRHNSQFIAY